MKYFILTLSFLVSSLIPAGVFAQTTYLNAQDLRQTAEIYFSPQQGTFLEGSTFQIPIFINTKGGSINAVELYLEFDPSRFSIVSPSGGVSIIGLWVEPPSYNNTKGTAKIVGTIPNGITTGSGLIATITFQAKAPGVGAVSLSSASQALMNDGIGTPVELQSNQGRYTVIAKPPEGAAVFSDTHPFQDRWYNNNNATLAWNKEPGVTGFSYILDNKPTTVPDNTITATDTIKAYEHLSDGMWYFHIKALKSGVWGAPTTFVLRIDTTPPAVFTPTIDYLSAAVVARFLVTFFTTDTLSGVDHYEVGVIDQSTPVTESPVFVQTESPYQLPFSATSRAQIIIRAFDRAGNIREGEVHAVVPFAPLKFITDQAVIILLGLLIIIIFFFILHYMFNHRLIRRIEKGMALLKEEEKKEKEAISLHNNPPSTPLV